MTYRQPMRLAFTSSIRGGWQRRPFSQLLTHPIGRAPNRTDGSMSWLLMAGMTPDERERYVDAVLLEGGFSKEPLPPAPEETEHDVS